MDRCAAQTFLLKIAGVTLPIGLMGLLLCSLVEYQPLTLNALVLVPSLDIRVGGSGPSPLFASAGWARYKLGNGGLGTSRQVAKNV
ncbi:hypothetical protein FQN60_004677 [Etheostoma spectabile]|uniref:Uncharacterized protein n=1 Tax=Etheostoma spectabile TaxID=54343 RepID=A0A5J5DKS6_9PERO|nr:hypothetical protein FQN60_004677 [Etheostoma spectabile]